jgi:putative peptide zinc metalloprotease protein
VRTRTPADARPGDEEAPRGIFGSAVERLNAPSGGAVTGSLWDRVEDRVVAPKPAPAAGRASLWDYLGQQMSLVKARPKLRDDLVIAQVEEAGTLYRVIKEPTSLNYYRFKENEYFILTQLDGHNELRDLVRLYSQHYRPIRPETVQNFLERVESFGLLARARASMYQRLLPKPLAVPVARLASLFRLNYSLPDTDGLTQRLYRRVSFVFRPPMVWFWTALALSGLVLVLLGWGRFVAELGGTLGSGWSLVAYLLALYAGMAVVIVIHELAHALTCVHYGGHVHKMGVMFYYVSLAAFADTSDAWLFSSRWARAWVSLAGPLSTLVCSALAALVWQLAIPGSPIARIATMLVLSTVPLSFANLNPFLEFDGYYILSDLSGIANLRKRSFAYVRAYLARLWRPKAQLPAAEPGQSRIFVGYGVLAAAYFVGLVLLPLGWQIASLLRRFGPAVGGLLAAALLALFGQRYLRQLYSRWRTRTHGRTS